MSTVVRMGVKRVAASVARPAQSRRAMSDGSRLAANRKIFQANPHLHGAENPTYTKKGTTDYAINIVAGLVITTGLCKFGNGLYNMAFGTNVLDIE